MKYLLIACIVLAMPTVVISQQYTLPAELFQSFLQDKNPSTGLDVTMELKINDDQYYETTIKYSDQSVSFKLKPLTYPSFKIKMKQAINDVIKQVKINDVPLAVEQPDGDLVERHITRLFTRIVTYLNTEEERPLVATVHLKSNKIPVYYNDSANTPVNKLEDILVELSFYGGFIEKIQVQGKIRDTPITFNNKFSIGISSTANIRQLGNHILFSDNKFSKEEINTILKENGGDLEFKPFKSKQKYSLKVKVEDVIRYVKKVDVNANDVSPVPQLLILDKNQKSSKLFREESTKLFEAVVYSDLLGLFEDNNPNGIVQTEISKRFNLNTRRTDIKNLHRALIFPNLAEGIGALQSFDAKFQYTKIESDNKFVLPKSFDSLDINNQPIIIEEYYSPISLYRLRNYAVGGILNLITMENQNSKLNMYLNAGFLFGRSGVRSSSEDTEGLYINNLEIPIEYAINILPEKRVSFFITNRLSWFDLFDSTLNLKSTEHDELVSKNRWINNIDLQVNVDLSSTGRLFMKYNYTHELDNINNNFSRLQFGYSFYLLNDNGSKKRK